MKNPSRFSNRRILLLSFFAVGVVATLLFAQYIQNNKTNLKQRAEGGLFIKMIHIGIDALQKPQTPAENTIIPSQFIQPVMEQVIAKSFNNTGATITWTTDKPTTSKIEYGITTTYGKTTAIITPLTTAHTQELTDLVPGTTYHYRIIATDGSGKTTASPDKTLTTITDTIASNPAKLIIKQVTQTATSGTIDITYTSTGNHREVHHSHYEIDGGPESMDLSFDGSYQLGSITPGSHTLTGFLVRSDHSKIEGSEHTLPLTIGSVTGFAQPTVIFSDDQTPPTIAITSPNPSATVTKNISLTASASDNKGVVGVQFFIDNQLIGSELTNAPYTFSWNTFEVNNGTHTLTAKARDAGGNKTTSNPVTIQIQNELVDSRMGKWSSVMNWPLVAVHATLLYTGEILMWDAWERPKTTAVVWNPTTQAFTSVPFASAGLFCSGHTQLPDGRISVAGGYGSTTLGITNITLFNPATKKWSSGTPMKYARWYPTVTRLSNGKVVILSGKSTSSVWADIPEVYDATLNQTSQMTTLKTTQLRQSQYPLDFLLPNGKVVSISPEIVGVQLLDTNTSTWTRISATSLLHGNAVQYRPGKILMSGGGTYNGSAQTTASVMDLNNNNPTWRSIAPMHAGRYLQNFVMLPDGKVLTVGGGSIVNGAKQGGPLSNEVWDPATEAWTTVAPMQKIRAYHSTAMLLPDGRVLSAGGGRLGVTQNELNAQFYSPSYLFKGTRPVIANAPSQISYGSSIQVGTPDSAAISKVTLIGLPSVTHGINMNASYSELTFQQANNALTIQAPTSNIAPPGYYMLFIINKAGVPSVAKIVKLAAPVATAPTPTPTKTPTPIPTLAPTLPIISSIKTTLKDQRVDMLAYANSSSKQLTLSLKNKSQDAMAVYGSLANLANVTTLAVYQKDAVGTLVPKAALTVTNGMFSLETSPGSTLILTTVSTLTPTPSTGSGPTATQGPTVTSVPTTTPTPTLEPTPTPTVAPTPTVIVPTNTPQPTPTAALSATTLSLVVALHGIGKGGDVLNPLSLGNMTPQSPQRSITVNIYDIQNQLVLTKESIVGFDATSGLFTGFVDLGTGIQTGFYSVKVKSAKYLRALVPGIQTITSGSKTTLPKTTLVAGDINNDNQISIIDYNILLGCFSDLTAATNCTDTNTKLADLTDDSHVNQFDYNFFLRELSTRGGQ